MSLETRTVPLVICNDELVCYETRILDMATNRVSYVVHVGDVAVFSQEYESGSITGKSVCLVRVYGEVTGPTPPHGGETSRQGLVAWSLRLPVSICQTHTVGGIPFTLCGPGQETEWYDPVYYLNTTRLSDVRFIDDIAPTTITGQGFCYAEQ